MVRLIAISLAFILLAWSSAGAVSINDFDGGLESWRFDFGAGGTITHDPAEGSPGNAGGAAKLVFNFPSTGGIAFTGDVFGTPTNLTGATDLLFDIKVDPASSLDAFGNHGFMQFVSRETDSYSWGGQSGQNLTAGSGWQTFSLPTTANGGLDMAATRALTFQLYGGPAQNLPGPVTLWLDNVRTSGVTTSDALYSFETGLEDWVPQGGGDSDYISHSQFTGNATNGTRSLQVVSGTGFGRDVQVTPAFGGAVYNAINSVAAAPANYTLDFDVTLDSGSWTNLTNGGNYLQFNVFANSDATGSTGGFQEVFGAGNAIPGTTQGLVKISVPASQLKFTPNSSFFQFGVGKNSDAAGTGSISYYLDNIRFTEIPQFVEETLFSWETPDNPGTSVNEQLEGWSDGFAGQPYFPTRTITTQGATDGASALAFAAPQSGFSWGTQFQLDSGVNGDPANQPRIDDLISAINGAEKIAFDVTFPADQVIVLPGGEEIPLSPTYLSLFVNVSDQSGTFYQSSARQAGSPLALAGQTITIEIPLSDLAAGGMNLGTSDLATGTYFRIALATNSDDRVNFSIDNFRLLSLQGAGLPGDANGDGSVDLLDLDILGSNFGTTGGATLAQGDFNDDGNVDLLDLDILGSNFGQMQSNGTAVPEPAALGLVFATLCGMAGGMRRRC